MLNLPNSINKKLENCNNILIVGAGGGSDVLCGLPLYYTFLKQNKKIISKWKIQLMNILKTNLKKLKIQIINYLIMIFYCKIIMICQIINFPMKKIKKYNIVILPNNKKVH